MWFTTTKVLGYLASPLSVSLLLVISGLLIGLAGWRLLRGCCLLAGLGLLWLCSMPFVEGQLRHRLESQYPPVAIADLPRADYIVVLGGAVAMPWPPRLEIELHDSSDRVLYAARLFHAQRAPQILIAAGNVYGERVTRPEAQLIADLLVEWDVPGEAIVVEGDSMTTYENALRTREVLEKRGRADAKLLLVTSAIHMPRAMAVFRARNLDVVAATTDTSAGPSVLPGLFDFLPSADALRGTTRLWHEVLGSWVYHRRGWM